MSSDPWAEDKLGRKVDGEHLKGLLIKRYKARMTASGSDAASYILNIDARWGEGKSFFLDCLARDLEGSGYIVARVNAWEDDMSSDPLTTVMAAIDAALSPFIEKDSKAAIAFRHAKEKLGAVAVEATKQVAFHALKAFTGLNVASLAKHWQGADGHAAFTDEEAKQIGDAAGEAAEKSLDLKSREIVQDRITTHRAARASVRDFKRDLAATLAALEADSGKARPFFVIVDELDRCRPDYAIRLLEEMKHLFDVPGVVFIVATDAEQLAHSVSAVYGVNFDGGRYLRRFYDSVFVFSDVDRGLYLDYLAGLYGIDFGKFQNTYDIQPRSHFLNWANAYQLSNRDLAQCLEMIAIAQDSWSYPIPIEPISFLAMAYAIYARLPTRDLLRKSFIGDKNDDLDKWIVSYFLLDHTHGAKERRQINVAAFLREFLTISRNDLSDWHQTSDYPFKAIFEREAAILHNRTFTVGQFYPSVTREYFGRLENAGRYIATAVGTA